MDHKTQVSYIFDALRRGKVPVKYIAAITGISRATFYNWKKDANNVDRVRLNIAYNAARRINAAIEAKRLPLDAGMTNADERLAQTKRIVFGGG